MPKCDECGKEFSSDAAVEQHLNDKHGIESAPPTSKPQEPKEPPTARKQRSLRKKNRHPRAIALVAVVVAVGLGVYFIYSPYFPPAPPFQGISGENWIHLHPYLTIDIEGVNVTIPADVGILQQGTFLEPIHTHDASGILHVELSRSDASSHNYTLGDFFTIWNYTVKTEGASMAPKLDGRVLPVAFSSGDILGFSTNSTYHVVLLVDGKPSIEWSSLNIEQLDYCSSANSGSPCCPTDCGSAGGPAADPLWGGSNVYPYGYGHTIVIEYVRI